MKDVLGNFGTGVTVVTALGPHGPIGFTCQTFASVSLTPPLVSICPARTSGTWAQIRDIGRFCINILTADHDALSDNFAISSSDGRNKFAGLEYISGPAGSPILPGVLAWVDCSLRAEYDGGDHTIVVADVLDLDTDFPDEDATNPLLYFRGDYLHRRGSEAEPA
ncbi:flavin reductase [Nakamurella antarctica]|uniref:Flavin reductase n=2 Tax=Nakamurella antarctica TaxID=1902245 RepID=A0A3G8ZPQ5_9ACTN|nr:flavin reductase [Nakamurella antarctica]